MKSNKCPFSHGLKLQGTTNDHWWPKRLKLDFLRLHSTDSNPYSSLVKYSDSLKELDFDGLKKDVIDVMTDSQDWWPADYGHYGPFFIRMAWHSAGTYRTFDGRGGGGNGNQRFAPLNSWPDNTNLDKARRLLWPIKQKYGQKVSWADLILFAGNCAIESMGLETEGFAFGREDIWESEQDIYWGQEKDWLGSERSDDSGKLEKNLSAVEMGLMYVNPEGPGGNPDPQAAANDIRETFLRMGMDDIETVALIAGGHTFGKAHGAASGKNLSAEPEGAPVDNLGLGWKSNHGKGLAEDTITSGLEGAWTQNPTRWDMGYLENLLNNDWELTESPAGAKQWMPTGDYSANVPDAHLKGKLHKPFMLTTDLALKVDAKYEKISKDFLADPDRFGKEFSKAWFKLLHRDLGPVSRYQGPEIPKENYDWQESLPYGDSKELTRKEIKEIKKTIEEAGLTINELVRLSWFSASTFRSSDLRGGANGARILKSPQKDWKLYEKANLNRVTELIQALHAQLPDETRNKLSMADLIILCGTTAIELAAPKGSQFEVEFHSGRVDAEKVNAKYANQLMPSSDAFSSYCDPKFYEISERLLIDKAKQLSLTVPELVVLYGGLKVININHDNSNYGVLTKTPGTLDNSFFINLLDMNISWKATDEKSYFFSGTNVSNGDEWQATRTDLIFGSHSELRAICEVYAQRDCLQKFLTDFSLAWTKIMELDMF